MAQSSVSKNTIVPADLLKCEIVQALDQFVVNGLVFHMSSRNEN